MAKVGKEEVLFKAELQAHKNVYVPQKLQKDIHLPCVHEMPL